MISMMRMVAALVPTELVKGPIGMVSTMSRLPVIAADCAINSESSMFSPMSHSFHYALEAIALFDISFVMLVGVTSNRSLFLMNEILDLS